MVQRAIEAGDLDVKPDTAQACCQRTGSSYNITAMVVISTFIAKRLPGQRRVLLALAVCALVSACSRESGPWLAFNGGGFVVNYSGGQYRAGQAGAYYGCNVKPLRHLAPGTVIEARFEDPAGGPPFVDSKTVDTQQPSYAFRSPYLSGIVANHPYQVEIRVLEAGSKTPLGSYTHSYSSSIDDAWLAK